MLGALARRIFRSSMPDLHLPEYAPVFRPANVTPFAAINCPVCNKNGEGTGHIVRFIGKDGCYMVWESVCPVCNGARRVVPRPDGDGLKRMDETSVIFCLDCGNRRRTLIPGDRSPTGKPIMAACPTCSVSEIVF